MSKNENSTRTVTTVVLMVMATMLSKVLGLVREMLLASHYGAGNTVAEAFSSAQSIPSSFFDILLSAAILGCFIPVYNSFKEESASEKESASRFACTFILIINLITGLLALAGIIFAKQLINIMTPGLDEETALLAAKLLRIMFPLIIFTGITYTLVGIMQSKEHFLLPAFVSAISNGGVIVYFLFIDKGLGENSIYGLALAYSLSWVIQFITLAIPLRAYGFKFRFAFDFKSPMMKKALKMIPPIMIGSWLLPAGFLIGKFFASSFMGVAVFNYANQSYIMIAGILTYSICNYVFPRLSRLSVEDNTNDFNSVVRTGLMCSWFIVIPFMAALNVLSEEGMSILYQRGEFSAEATALTASAIGIISFAMPAFSTIEFLSRTFYSKKQTSAPMFAALLGVVVNIAVSYVSVNIFHGKIEAVAFANALGQICAAALLIIFAIRKNKGLFNKAFVVNILKTAVSGALCFAVMKIIHRVFENNAYDSGPIKNIAVVFAVFIPGAAVYLISAKLFRIRFKSDENQMN